MAESDTADSDRTLERMWKRPWLLSGSITLALISLGCITLIATTSSTRTQLTIIGATLEAVGIALVTLDFWAPIARRVGQWLKSLHIRARLRMAFIKLVDWMKRRKRTTVTSSFTMPFETAGAITPKLTGPRVSSFDEVSERLQAISDRITTIEGENARAHDRLGNEMVEREERLRSDVQEWIARSKDQYLSWRIVGLVVALSGTLVLAAANLAPS